MFLPLIAAALLFSADDAAFALTNATEFVRDCTPRDAGTEEGRQAACWIRTRARAMGLPTAFDAFEGRQLGIARRFVNVVSVVRRNRERPWTVFVSHYDTKPGCGCPGANDGASTTGLLLALGRSILRAEKGACGNVMLVWTDAEESRGMTYGADDGLLGSRHLAGEFRRLGLDIGAVVVLDMLGDCDLHMMVPLNVSPSVRRGLFEAARRCGFGEDVLSIGDMCVKDDHVPFIEQGFPAAVLIDFDYGLVPGLNDFWHTPQDTPDKLSAASLQTGGRLAIELLRFASLR